jgi:hypothetical protein
MRPILLVACVALAGCEFVRGRDEGSDSCWTEGGSPESLRR